MALSEQRRARILLDIQKYGYSVGLILRHNWRRYVFLITGIGLVLALTYALGQPEAFYIVLGMLIGSLLRDLGWFRTMRIAWLFNVRVMNWDKVQRIADGEQV